MDAEIAPGGPGFLAGGGEMGALMRAHDWAATPVGPPETWPTALKTTVRLMLTSQHSMFIWWGAELTSFYNDAYSVLIGPDRHPAALGRPGQEVWAEVWDVAGPQIEFVMAGHGATWHERQLIPITRGDTREDVWWTYGFSPIDDEAAPAGVGGVLMVSRDVTAEMNAEAALRDLAASLEKQVEARTRERDRLWVVSQDISVVIDPQGIFQAINHATTRVLGWSSAEMVGKTVFDFILAEDVAATSGALAHATHDVLPSHVSRYRHRDGGFGWLLRTMAASMRPRATSRPRRPPRPNLLPLRTRCANRRRWKRSASSRGAWPMTSTTCSPESPGAWSCSRRGSRKAASRKWTATSTRPRARPRAPRR